MEATSCYMTETKQLIKSLQSQSFILQFYNPILHTFCFLFIFQELNVSAAHVIPSNTNERNKY